MANGTKQELALGLCSRPNRGWHRHTGGHEEAHSVGLATERPAPLSYPPRPACRPRSTQPSEFLQSGGRRGPHFRVCAHECSVPLQASWSRRALFYRLRSSTMGFTMRRLLRRMAGR